MIDKSEVLSIVKEKGPVLPRDVVREVGGDTFLVGAVLSQLTDNKDIKISHTKIGGSPVYYAAGQEEKIQKLYDYLHEKEKKAYDMLKDRKLLKDSSLEPVIRVAIRNIRDFAKPLEVNHNGVREIFWKWYLYDNQSAEDAIRSQLSREQPRPIEQPVEKPEKPVEKQEILAKKEQSTPEDTLGSDVHQLFEDKKIEILEEETIRKNSDMELTVKIPSPVGKLTYFCKVKNKKKINDKDLSAAYVQGQMKKLPVLFVTTGKLTNKAEEMLDKEFKMLSVLHL